MKATEIHFEISLAENLSHIYQVRCVVKNPSTSQLTFSIPSWTPGSYMIRDFAQHVTTVSANGALSKLDKDTWTCSQVHGDVVIDYEVYAFDPSVRAAFLDDSYAFFTGTSVFMRIHGHEGAPHYLTISKAPFESRVATAMPFTNGSYSCANYDELVDHPVMICDFDLLTFEVEGVPHKIACYPKLSFDKARLTLDCEKLCKEQIRLFGSPAPFSHYLFLLKIEESGYGGLEHRASSALICKIADLPMKHQAKMSDDYRGLLGLISHEYFHAWNVKRLKPEPFLSYAYNRENYTELLWFFEGFTSYYDDLILRRCGVIDTTSYLELLSKTISRVYAEQGRFKQSLAEASFDSWIKFYKPNENSPNALVSYYMKGSLVALALDFFIRNASGNEKNLDDVMRALWSTFALLGKGISERDIIEHASKAAGTDLKSFFQTHIHTTTDLPLAELFVNFGVELKFKEPVSPQVPYLGCTFRRDTESCLISSVTTGSPAMEAGLCAGDLLIAIDDLKVQSSNLDARLNRYTPGSQLKLHLFRKGWLKQVQVTLGETPKTKCALALVESATGDQQAALAGWLESTG